MPPRRGGGIRGRKKDNHSSPRTGTPTINTPQQCTTEVGNRQNANLKSEFGIAPLILEGESLTKIKINYLIKYHLPGVKVLNIQVNRPNSFTLYAGDVNSFNRLLNELTPIIQTEEKLSTCIYIPRSIQRILENNKEAFIKMVDLEISEEDIKNTLNEQGYKYEKVIRMMNKEKMPLKTIKITFSDTSNRNLFVKLGLQIDSMHFKAEAANLNNKPSQCYKCLKFGHFAKYCRAEKQICSRCGEENHKYDECPNINKNPRCYNCKGEHFATSQDCPKYKDHQQKIQKTIDQYSSKTKSMEPTHCPSWKNNDDFPVLYGPDKIEQKQIIEILSEKIIAIVEQATLKIFENLYERFNMLTIKLSKKFNIEVDDILIEEENKQVKKNNNKQINSQHKMSHEQPSDEIMSENAEPTQTSTNGAKRKYISPSSIPSKPINTIKDKNIED